MSQQRSVILYVADRAPMAHPVLIALHELEVSYELRTIDPYDKPDWYRTLTPTGAGLVPLLLVDEQPLFESTVINEYLAETFEGSRLLPADPIRRAINRAWTLQAFDFLMAQAAMMVVKNREDHEMARAMFVRKVTLLATALTDGPFFNGSDISLVDFQFAPILVRQEVLDRRYGTDVLSAVPRVARWTQALIERESVISTLSPDGARRAFDEVFLPSFYDSYLTTQRAGRLYLVPTP